jgi:hypothetical protein
MVRKRESHGGSREGLKTIGVGELGLLGGKLSTPEVNLSPFEVLNLAYSLVCEVKNSSTTLDR